MVISIDEILRRNLIKRRDYAKGEGLVEPEGVAVDIRLDEIWEMNPKSEAFLKKKTRKTREYKKVTKFLPNKDDSFVLEPAKYYQFKSIEEIEVPLDLMGRFTPRFNLLANGMYITFGKLDPGFKGNFVVPVINLSGVPFEIELGIRFGQVGFYKVAGKSIKYRGQWKNGRVYTKKEEVQV